MFFVPKSLPRPFAWALLISPFFFWGTAMVAMKGVLPQTGPFFVASARLIPAGVLVLLFAALQGRAQPQGWRAWSWISLFALIDGTCFQGFLAEGLNRTGAGLGSVIIDSQPLVVAMLSSWLFQERIGLWGCVGLILGIVGISFIGLPDQWFYDLWTTQSVSFHWDWGALVTSGEALMLCASLSMAVGTVLIPFVSQRVDTLVATGWHMIFGGLPLLALSLTQEGEPWRQISLYGWFDLAYATVFGGAVAYGVFFYLAAQGNLTSLSALTFLTPIFALSFGNLLLEETLSSLQWAGVMLTLASIYLINQRQQIALWVQQGLRGFGIAPPENSREEL